MMANEQPAGAEEPKKEEEAAKVVQPSELTNGEVCKMSNGDVHNADADVQKPKDAYESMNGNAPGCPDLNKTDEHSLLDTPDNNAETEEKHKETDSHLIQSACKPEIVVEENSLIHNNELDIETHEIEVQEQIFTSTHTLVVTKQVETTVVEEQREVQKVSLEETVEEFEETEKRIEAEEMMMSESAKEQPLDLMSTDVPPSPQEMISSREDKESEIEDNQYDVPEQLDSPDSLETIEIPDSGNDFEHFTVLESRSTENEITVQSETKHEFTESYSSAAQETTTTVTNEQMRSETVFSQSNETEEKTFDDHFVLDTREAISPIEDEDKKDLSSRKSRIHTLGVQKTEQPYSTCTTETKIAMEIREMREREEELKKMRERQAQVSPAPPPQKAPAPPKVQSPQKQVQPPAYLATNGQKANTTPGYRVSSVFGHRAASQVKEENKFNRNFNKESAVEREIRLAKDREEELRRQKGLPPREDDSYVKPSQIKSSQAKAFGKMANAENSRLIATAKIQHEIEEQTLRELALRESGHIQTLSCERTDAKVTKLKPLEVHSPECTSPTFQNGNGPSYLNGLSSNGHVSPDYAPSKRSTPSPTGSNHSSQYSVPRSVLSPTGNKGISMQKFIASRGKETTFAAPRNGPFSPKADYQDTSSRSIPEPGKLKRTVSVESKIQQEILEMKLREEELKLLHTRSVSPTMNGNNYENMMRTREDYHQNGGTDIEEESCPRRSNLIAQWEQRIQKSEGRA